MKNEVILSINIQRHLMNTYRGLQDMDDYKQMYEFIFDVEEREYNEETREYALQEDEMKEIVEGYMENLKETIEGTMEFFYNRGMGKIVK
jgi:DNA replication initiation complex subunit (GINS family)